MSFDSGPIDFKKLGPTEITRRYRIPIMPNFERSRIFVLGDSALAGGKAIGLLIVDPFRNGKIDIPRTVVIDAEFFNIAPRSLTNPELIRTLPQERIDRLFEIIQCLRWPFAIRSSSQVEDGKGSVAAGKFKTEFHGNQVNTPESRRRFVEKLLSVLNSAYREETIPYWIKRGFSTIPQIPVIIQEVVGETSVDGRYFIPQISGIINTSLNTEVRVSTVLGLGVTAVGDEGLGMLHLVPRNNLPGKVDAAVIPTEGFLNSFEIGCIDLQTGDLVHLKDREADRLFPEKIRNAIQSTFPATQVKLAEIALELEEKINLAHGTNYAYDLEWVSDGRNIWIVQLRPIERQIVREKPANIPAQDLLLESQDVIGHGSKDVSHIIHIKSAYGDTDSETIQGLRTMFPNCLIIYDTDVFHYFTSRTVARNIMPNMDAVVVIDRASKSHKAGTGLQHFALNAAEEGKVFIYTDNIDLPEKVARLAQSATRVQHGMFSMDEITAYQFVKPIRIAADAGGKWGMIYVPQSAAEGVAA